MNARQRIGLLLCLALAGGCQGYSQEGRAASTEEVSGILSKVAQFVLDSTWAEALAIAPETRVLPGDTVDDALLAWLNRELGETPKHLAEAFNAYAGRPHTLADSVLLDGSPLVLDDTWQQLFDVSHVRAWSELRRQLGPKTVLLNFGWPAVDVTGETALAYYEFICGPAQCAEGHYVLLRKLGTQWFVENDVILWTT